MIRLKGGKLESEAQIGLVAFQSRSRPLKNQLVSKSTNSAKTAMVSTTTITASAS